jgi:uncharacterized membrane protein
MDRARMFSTGLVAVVLTAPMAARAGPDRDAPPRARCHAEATGRLLGGIAGALIGRELGEDRTGRAIGTVGGAVIGGVIGGQIGRRIDADDPACSAPLPPSPRERIGAAGVAS